MVLHTWSHYLLFFANLHTGWVQLWLRREKKYTYGLVAWQTQQAQASYEALKVLMQYVPGRNDIWDGFSHSARAVKEYKRTVRVIQGEEDEQSIGSNSQVSW